MYKKGGRVLNIFVNDSVKKSWLMGAVCACVTTMSSFTVNAASTVTSLTGTIEVMAEAGGIVDHQVINRPPSTLSWIDAVNASSIFIAPPLAAGDPSYCFDNPGTPECMESYTEVSAYADTNSTIAASGEHFIANGTTEAAAFTDSLEYPGVAESYALSSFGLFFSLDSAYNYSLIGQTVGWAEVDLSTVGLFGGPNPSSGVLLPFSSSGVLAPGDYSLYAYAVADDMVFGHPDPVFSHYSVELILSPVATVPVPAAVWLFGSGLLGLVGIARRKKA